MMREIYLVQDLKFTRKLKCPDKRDINTRTESKIHINALGHRMVFEGVGAS